jgi:hypothetical protein
MLRCKQQELEGSDGQEAGRQRGTEDGATGLRARLRVDHTVWLLWGRVARGPAAVASVRERSQLRQEERPPREPQLNRVVVKGRR